MSAGLPLDRLEQLLWTILKKLEDLALGQYEQHAPALALPGKRAIIERLSAGADEELLRSSELAAPVADLLVNAASKDQPTTLMVNGLLLERLGMTLYAALSKSRAASDATRAMAEAGRATSAQVSSVAVPLLAQVVGEGEKVFQLFASATRGVLSCLETLAEGVDHTFKDRFALGFGDLIGEFTAELIPACMELGMSRRKIVSHLTAAFMGV